MGKGAAFDECACYTTRRAARQLGQAYDRALRPSGLTNTQFSTLAVISLSEGSAGIDLTMSELAARIGVERTTLTRNLEVMRRDGLVRVMAGADARCKRIELTAKGGITSTRWRDYVDIVQLDRRGIDDDELLRSARAVAQYRGATLEPVAPHLAGYGAVAQAKWATEHGRCQHCWRHWKPAHVGRRNMDLLDAKQVSEMIGVPVGTLRHWRHSDIGPASFTLGRRVVYRRDEVSRWISKRESATRR